MLIITDLMKVNQLVPALQWHMAQILRQERESTILLELFTTLALTCVVLLEWMVKTQTPTCFGLATLKIPTYMTPLKKMGTKRVAWLLSQLLTIGVILLCSLFLIDIL